MHEPEGAEKQSVEDGDNVRASQGQNQHLKTAQDMDGHGVGSRETPSMKGFIE